MKTQPVLKGGLNPPGFRHNRRLNQARCQLTKHSVFNSAGFQPTVVKTPLVTHLNIDRARFTLPCNVHVGPMILKRHSSKQSPL